MEKTYKDDIAAALHEMATGIHEAGLMLKSTLHEFDELCLSERLTPVEKLTPEEIKATGDHIRDNPGHDVGNTFGA